MKDNKRPKYKAIPETYKYVQTNKRSQYKEPQSKFDIISKNVIVRQWNSVGRASRSIALPSAGAPGSRVEEL